MSTVFILGAGASHGDTLLVKDELILGTKPTPPPLINGFFRQELLTKINYSPKTAEIEFREALDWIRTDFPDVVYDTSVGDTLWDNLNLEEIITAVELRREFESPESSDGASLLRIRNQLVDYVTFILGLCTYNCYGQFSRQLISGLDGDDSLLTFNWDLLLDEAFEMHDKPHLRNFLATRYSHEMVYKNGRGLFLKLHGSLNWFLCTNSRCKFASEIRIDPETQYCLSQACKNRAPSDVFTASVECPHCGGDTRPFIVPPLVRKPITENPTIRSVWGLARRQLQFADRMVLIGFSAAATDFFIAWLVRSAILDKGQSIRVTVVNPLNDPTKDGHTDFMNRMSRLAPYGFNGKFQYFSELDKFI